MSEPPHKRARMDAGPAVAVAAEPTPQPAAASASEPAALTAPPHARLHRHALESIFAFLSFRRIRSVMFVSRDWLAAVYSMRGVGHTVLRPDELPGGLQSLLYSRLARHITSLGGIPRLRTPSSFRVLPSLLRQISAAMPYLTRLACIPLNGEEWRGAFPLPSALTELDLSLPEPIDAGSVNGLLTHVGRHQAVQTLTIGSDVFALNDSGPPRMGTGVDFTPLAAMPALRKLHIGSVADPSDAQVQQLRSLTQLTLLNVEGASPNLLSRLLASGHQLGWTELGIGLLVDDAAAPLLTSLTPLRELRLGRGVYEDATFRVSALDFLVPLTQLTHLTLDLQGYKMEVQHTLLTLPLRFPLLTRFVLTFASFTCVEVGTLLSRMPALAELVLRSMEELESLSFLFAYPLRSTLRHLHLFYCRHPDLAPVELAHLRGMQLTSLTLCESLSAPLDDLHLAFLRPTSLILPHLVIFEYYEPLDDD